MIFAIFTEIETLAKSYGRLDLVDLVGDLSDCSDTWRSVEAKHCDVLPNFKLMRFLLNSQSQLFVVSEKFLLIIFQKSTIGLHLRKLSKERLFGVIKGFFEVLIETITELFEFSAYSR